MINEQSTINNIHWNIAQTTLSGGAFMIVLKLYGTSLNTNNNETIQHGWMEENVIYEGETMLKIFDSNK